MSDPARLRRPRPRAGEALDAIGRASRYACGGDPGNASGDVACELWCVGAGDLGLVKKLVALGEKGLGGFDVGWGDDAEGVFAMRRIPSRTLEGLAKGERLDGKSALAKVRDLARALAACERSAIFPGPLRPSDVVLTSEGRTDAWVLADHYVRTLVGGQAKTGGSSGPSTRWTPPEQVDGAPWDNAANRYVLGLVAYRLVAGAHPFSGIGLRDAIRAQSSAPPPFDDAIARALVPGIQSFVLAMLDPDRSKRPSSAEEIVRRCEGILRGDDRTSPKASPEPARPAEIVAAPPRPAKAAPAAAAATLSAPASRSPLARLARMAAPIVVGLGVAGLAIASKGEPPPAAAPPPHIAARRPIEKTTSETCAQCHARQVAEWQRSVMAHSVKSPLFGALESVVEEQVGRDSLRCPNGAGALRRQGGDVCRDEKTGFTVTGSGGEHWCVNCHAAGDNLASTMPAWSAQSNASARKPLRDLLTPAAMEGISCALCHETIGPVHAGGVAGRGGRGEYEGNATWTSFATGAVFRTRPEDGVGVTGIGNSGYLLDSSSFLARTLGGGGPGDPIVHKRASAETKSYLASSEFCGACHDVRLFGTDSLGVRERGEHFKRLRNAYSEWKTWADTEKAAGRKAASCQDCHMSLYPGVCVADAAGSSAKGGGREGCPPGFHFEARAPGEKARGMIASSSIEPRPITSHFFTSVDLPLAAEFPETWATDPTLDASGIPLGLARRREQLLRHTFQFAIGRAARVGGQLEIPIEIKNTGAGHRVPAGFSQEREIWVEMTVKDARGDVVYQVGKIASDDADLQDKVMTRITTRDDVFDGVGRGLATKPAGVFGADVVDGPDVPRWNPNPLLGGTTFRGRGLVNFQNGFLRCVKCIGVIDAEGRCQAGPGQGRTRADRFDDGAYDLDTGECRSNLTGANAFFETFFPVGALDADRGLAKAPDAIIDTRSAPPGAEIRYTYELPTAGHPGPFKVEAKLRFRPFPPFLLRAFADYEARKAAQGLRPSGPQVTPAMFRRNAPIDLAEVNATIP
ncbi:MAG: hypothetical protein JST00_28955 [Deltaproteobacteria bacterium]|nr:hypothetical protein [Deltaproteobacteria bacterium]